MMGEHPSTELTLNCVIEKFIACLFCCSILLGLDDY